MIPTKAQWRKWSLPSKYSAIGIFIGIISLIPLLPPILNNQKNITATDYAKNTQWYLDTKLTSKNMPTELKSELSDINLKKELLDLAKISFGVHSDKYKVVSNMLNNDSGLIEAFLFISQAKLVITDKNMKFTTGTSVKETHKMNSDCTGSIIEFKSASGNIINVTKNGIDFEVPTQSFTELYGCSSRAAKVDYQPATARLEGSILVMTLKEGARTMHEEKGEKTVKRIDMNLYFRSTPGSLN